VVGFEIFTAHLENKTQVIETRCLILLPRLAAQIGRGFVERESRDAYWSEQLDAEDNLSLIVEAG
jgi:hypothetical protein